MDPEFLVRELLEVSSTDSSSIGENVAHRLALGLARKNQMENLLSQLFSCPMPNYTPDGLPTLSILQNEQVDALFL